MQVLQVCCELFPLMKVGGLADVTGALPTALAKLGCENRILVPGFPNFMNKTLDQRVVATINAKFGVDSIQIISAVIPGSDILLYIINAKELYDRPGSPYVDINNQDYPDNYRRFALLSYIAMRLADGLDNAWVPDILHCHDWHAGLTPAYLKAGEAKNGKKLAPAIFTIHNLAYQGIFDKNIYNELELPQEFLVPDKLEFQQKVSFMQSGISFADKITTVSPSYAIEIQTEKYGCGLNNLLVKRKHDLCGILNGIDLTVWSPQLDPVIVSNYNNYCIDNKLKCKKFLQQRYGLKIQNSALLFVIVSRLTEQKGLDLVLKGLNTIVENGGQIIILGTGDKAIEEAFNAAALNNPTTIAVRIAYDEDEAHHIIAGGDVILVPSRFEPCGLTQLYGLRYGTIPLVHLVGGLGDTVIDASEDSIQNGTANGIVFNAFNLEAYEGAIKRAFSLYLREGEWNVMQKYAMQQNFGWRNSAKKYLEVYKNSLL